MRSIEQTRRRAMGGLLAAMASAGAVVPALGQTAPPPLAPPVPPTPEADAAARVDAARDPYEHLIAPVSINGQGPFRFIVDTGANVSCVSRKLSERLGLPITERHEMHTIVAMRSQPLVLIDELTVGERRRRRVGVLSIPLSEDNIDGVLGVDWLAKQRLTLDFVNKRLTFEPSRREASEKGRVVVPARRRLGQLTIVDADLGAIRVSAMIDSGSQVTMCNDALLQKVDKAALRGGPRLERNTVHLVSIVGEQFAGEEMYLPFLRLADLQLGNVPVVHATEHVFELWGLKDTPAVLLGMDLLRQFRAVSLDFGRSQVRFDLVDA